MLKQQLESPADNAKPGLSVREVMAQAFSQTDRQIWHEIIERTTGDVAPVVADLFDVVRYLFLADCQQKRPNTWKRPLSVNLPVRALEVWQRREVQETLHSLLEFTCGDDVVLHFEDVHAPAPRVQPCLSFETKCRVCLLSDGLDSLCGLTQRLSVDSATPIVAATCLTQYQVERRVCHIVSDLNATFGHRVLPVTVPLYRTGYRTRPPGEPSQRLRSVLLLGVGAVIALLAGQSGLEVYENGIEVCNFPLALTPEPERLSRAMHPVLLKRMSLFLSALADREFVCSAPFALDTKAEMVKATRLILPDETLLRTVSCMHYRNTQCGGCEGCVLRRQALFCAGAQTRPPSTASTSTLVEEPQEYKGEKWRKRERSVPYTQSITGSTDYVRQWPIQIPIVL